MSHFITIVQEHYDSFNVYVNKSCKFVPHKVQSLDYFVHKLKLASYSIRILQHIMILLYFNNNNKPTVLFEFINIVFYIPPLHMSTIAIARYLNFYKLLSSVQ